MLFHPFKYLGGKCINYLQNSGVCFCPIGYSGLQCQIGSDESLNSTKNVVITSTTKSSVKGVCDIIRCNNGKIDNYLNIKLTFEINKLFYKEVLVFKWVCL